MSQIEVIEPYSATEGIASVPRRLTSQVILLIAWGIGLAVLFAGLFFAPELFSVILGAIGVGVPLLFLVWRRQELGILVLAFLTAGFIPRNAVEVRLPVGSLDMRDMVVLGMIAMLLILRYRSHEFTLPWWPVSATLLIFIGVGVISLLYALLYLKVDSSEVLAEFRAVFYYGAFFVSAWSLRTPRQLFALLIGLFILSDVTTFIVIYQQVLGKGNPIIDAMTGSNWQVWQMVDTPGQFGTVKIVPPNHVLMYIMQIIAFCLLMYSRQTLKLRLFFGFQFAFIGVGLLFTYTRAQWIASAVALALVFLLLPSAHKGKLVRIMFAAVFIIAVSLSLFADAIEGALGQTEFLSALSDRAGSIFTPQQTLETYSLDWRVFETGESLKSISNHPILGVGLGNTYRAVTLFQGEANSIGRALSGFIHNSYLYIAVKMGLLGLAAFICFIGTFLFNTWRTYKSVEDEQSKLIVLAIFATMLGFLTWVISHPHLMIKETTLGVGIMLGVVAGIRQIEKMDLAHEEV